MKRICAWCQKELPSKGTRDDSVITHGMCDECLAYYKTNGSSLRDFLNKLKVPVLAVDGNVTVLTASDQACSMLDKELPEVQGRLGGDAIECAYARLPGGCGKTVHCRSCTIRLTVTDTYATGRSHEKVPAYADLEKPDGVKNLRFLISTEKMGDIVLLRIDDVTAR